MILLIASGAVSTWETSGALIKSSPPAIRPKKKSRKDKFASGIASGYQEAVIFHPKPTQHHKRQQASVCLYHRVGLSLATTRRKTRLAHTTSMEACTPTQREDQWDFIVKGAKELAVEYLEGKRIKKVTAKRQTTSAPECTFDWGSDDNGEPLRDTSFIKGGDQLSVHEDAVRPYCTDMDQAHQQYAAASTSVTQPIPSMQPGQNIRNLLISGLERWPVSTRSRTSVPITTWQSSPVVGRQITTMHLQRQAMGPRIGDMVQDEEFGRTRPNPRQLHALMNISNMGCNTEDGGTDAGLDAGALFNLFAPPPSSPAATPRHTSPSPLSTHPTNTASITSPTTSLASARAGLLLFGDGRFGGGLGRTGSLPASWIYGSLRSDPRLQFWNCEISQCISERS
ncbi:hypothetical protein NP233_g3743 [Leucocoprinus birnbaumii]|uniref:Uncharacterized protein n=1 Tax=Leucocoprinus birnbaumii TaxID=56174 RepID=A0AAD5VWN8_9AGAR|nr:hypothetical protein NP233_g3743 [Leucocoprinus birnbaumii]